MIEASQTVGDDVHIVDGQVGNAVCIVIVELPDHPLFYLFAIFIVGLVLAQGTVAFCTDDTFRLVNREVERSCEVCVFPGLPLLYMEVAATVVWHRPDDDGNGGNNEYCSGENIPPMEFFHTLYLQFLCKDNK